MLNLRTSARGKYGHYTAHLLDPEIEHSFIAVGNPRLRLLVLYVLIGRVFLGRQLGRILQSRSFSMERTRVLPGI